MVVEGSKEQGDKLKSQKEKEKLSKHVESVCSKWELISILAKEHRDNVSKVLTIVFDHHENMECIVEVIKQGDKTLNASLPIGFDIERGRVQLKQIRVGFAISNYFIHSLFYSLYLLPLF